VLASLNSERFGSAQLIAGVLLLLFLAQCLWFCAHAPLSDREIAYVMEGQKQWHGIAPAFHEQPSPITGLIASAAVFERQSSKSQNTESQNNASQAAPDIIPPSWKWLARLPFMAMALLFGASLWYVARRLYGNVAGYIALVLYAFSPIAIVRASTVQPNVIADWGAFGAIFTAIGLAHTLYAPREVVLWNWKRILLLGLALGLATAAQFSVVIVIPIALGFMWYLAPERRAAATVIMLAGCAVAFAILLTAYGFHFGELANGIRNAHLYDIRLSMFRSPITYTMLGVFLLRQPTSLLLFLIAIGTYAVWKRARFFGTTAPLLVFAILAILGIAMPHQGGLAFYIMALPFSYVFISGVMVDLLESKQAPIMLGVVIGVLLGHIGVNLVWLSRMG
jgi:hypothetical protein